MSAVHTSIVTPAHGYTRTKTPWILDSESDEGGRLAHYLSGGGMRTFGRTLQQELARIRHRRFWVVASVLAALWLVFYLI